MAAFYLSTFKYLNIRVGKSVLSSKYIFLFMKLNFKKNWMERLNGDDTSLFSVITNVIIVIIKLMMMMMMMMMLMNCFCGMVDRPKAFSRISSQDHCQRHTTNRNWTCAESEFWHGWMRLCSSDNHYITAKFETLKK